MNKLKIIITTAVITTSILTIGAFAAGKVYNIQAQMRGDITVTVDGTTQTFKNAQGEIVQPISYGGSTYLPVRAIGELMGKTVGWNETTKTVSLNNTGTVVNPDPVTDFDTNTGSTGNTSLDNISSRITALSNEINALKRQNSYQANYTLYKQYELKISALDNELDLLDNQYENKYHAGTITYSDYKNLEFKIDALEKKLDTLDNTLEFKLGIDD